MIDFFLRNAGGKMKALAKWTMFFAIFGAIAILITAVVMAVVENDGRQFFSFALYAVAAFAGGWVSALIFQCLGEAAAPAGITVTPRSGWTCRCGRANEPGRRVCPRCGADRR